MSTEKPTFFVPDILDRTIQSDCLHFQPFESIYGSPSLEVFDNQKQIQIQLKLMDCENEIHSQFPNNNFFRVFTHQGAYWLDQEGMNRTAAFFDARLKNFKKEETQPLWKLTTSEIQTYHEKNLRHLIQTVSNDSVLLNTIKTQVNGSSSSFVHQFDECRQKINQLLKNFEKKESSPVGRDDMQILFERCRITRTMLERGEIDGSLLGHSQQDLIKVQHYLEDRCLNVDPNFLSNYQLKYQKRMAELVVGEKIQLIRTQEWGRFFDLIDEIPQNYETFVRFVNCERLFLDSFSSKRIQELESDIFCRNVVNTINKGLEDLSAIARMYMPKSVRSTTPRREPLPELVSTANFNDADGVSSMTDRQVQSLLAKPNKSSAESEQGDDVPLGDGLSPDDDSQKRISFLNRNR